MPTDHFGEDVAARYDEEADAEFEPGVIDATVEFLRSLAGDGAALELAIGTGRIALPLSRAGVEVHGIDLSTAMVARLRGKPGADAIEVTIGDIASTTATGRFRLVYLLFNTIMNLTTQDAQVACFRNAAAHLEAGGHFVVEVMVPELQSLPLGETIRPGVVTDTRLSFDEYDVIAQGLISHHFRAGDDGIEGRSIPFRYVWPAELDLMAQLAGLHLVERVAGWDRAPFTATSPSHVSVYERTAG